jgi:hypothetical protein
MAIEKEDQNAVLGGKRELLAKKKTAMGRAVPIKIAPKRTPSSVFPKKNVDKAICQAIPGGLL